MRPSALPLSHSFKLCHLFKLMCVCVCRFNPFIRAAFFCRMNEAEQDNMKATNFWKYITANDQYSQYKYIFFVDFHHLIRRYIAPLPVTFT